MANSVPTANMRVLISRETIQSRVTELGRQIRDDYGDRPIYLIGILKGACIFLSDLARAIPGSVRFDFMGISSYGKGKTSSGEVKVTKDLDVSLEGVDVLVVEDIVDTGVTLTYLTQILRQRRPRSIEVAAFLDKPSRRMRPVEVKYVGFSVPDEFVIGYGLDYAEDYRNVPDICVLES